MNAHSYAVNEGDEGNKGQIWEREDEDADREFNFVINHDIDYSDYFYLL